MWSIALGPHIGVSTTAGLPGNRTRPDATEKSRAAGGVLLTGRQGSPVVLAAVASGHHTLSLSDARLAAEKNLSTRQVGVLGVAPGQPHHGRRRPPGAGLADEPGQPRRHPVRGPALLDQHGREHHRALERWVHAHVCRAVGPCLPRRPDRAPASRAGHACLSRARTPHARAASAHAAVRCFGTEGRRKGDGEVAATDQVYEYVVFKGERPR